VISRAIRGIDFVVASPPHLARHPVLISWRSALLEIGDRFRFLNAWRSVSTRASRCNTLDSSVSAPSSLEYQRSCPLHRSVALKTVGSQDHLTSLGVSELLCGLCSYSFGSSLFDRKRDQTICIQAQFSCVRCEYGFENIESFWNC